MILLLSACSAGVASLVFFQPVMRGEHTPKDWLVYFTIMALYYSMVFIVSMIVLTGFFWLMGRIMKKTDIFKDLL